VINDILFKLAGFTTKKAFIFALLAAGFYYVSLYDDGKTIDTKRVQIEKQIAEEQKKSKESDEALKELEQYRGSVVALNEQFKIAAQQLPSEISASEILKSIDTISKSTGVSVKLKEQKTKKREDIVEMLPLRVVVHGGFSEITMFLYYLSSMERITRAVNFTFAIPSGTDVAKVKQGALVFDGEIMSYKYVPGLRGEQGVKRR